MKIIFSFLIALLAANQCSQEGKKSQQQDMYKIEVIYEISSMTNKGQIVINTEKVKTINLSTHEKKERPLLSRERNDIEKALRQIDLSRIGELKAPTNKRLYDGAPHAVLIIRNENKELRSSGFDHGEPPQELKELVDEIIKIGGG